ncbi:MAG: hypothetical protein JNJ57_18245 [Saprospiraceae bacterium]|nr:hypothetical protein [Saprospiraceae bacterium]
MKHSSIIIALLFPFSLLVGQSASTTIQNDPAAIAANLLSVYDAEKIFGGPAALTENTIVRKNDSQLYKCAYVAQGQDLMAGRPSVLDLSLEEFNADGSASVLFGNLRKEYESEAGFQTVFNLGSEAFFTSDNQNYYYILIRKNNKLLGLSLKKIPNSGALESFKMAAIFLNSLI